MKNIKLFFLLVFSQFIVGIGLAQDYGAKEFYLIDSLDLSLISESDLELINSSLANYHKATSDTAKIGAINFIVNECWDGNVWPRYNNWVFEFTQKRITDLSSVEEKDLKKIKALKGYLSMALNNIGYIHSDQGDMVQALDYYNQSFKISCEIGDRAGIAETLNNIGFIYYNQGNIPTALNYFHQSLKMLELLNDKTGTAGSLNNIGTIHSDQLEFKIALGFYQRALEIYKSIDDQQGIALSLHNIAFIFENQGDLEKALDYYKRSIKIKEAIGDKRGLAVSLNNIGAILQRKGEMDEALNYYNKSLIVSEEIEHLLGVTTSLHNLGQVYLDKNDLTNAKVKAERAHQISTELGYPNNIADAAQLLKEIYQKQGDYKNAFLFYQEEITMRDSLQNEANYKQAIQQQTQYKYEKEHAQDSIAFVKEQEINVLEIERQNAEIAVQENKQYALFGGLALVLLFSGFMYNRFRVTQKQKLIIEGQKHEVELQKEVIEEKHKEITDSINYAERIQRALMASDVLLNQHLKDYFIYFNPKEAVSGDFYWASKLTNRNFCLVAADSTGHGVPGAIMSILNIACLKEAVTKEITSPDLLLNETRKLVIENLKNDGSKEGGKDGMDCCLLSFDFVNKKLEFALANNPMWIIRQEELIEFAPDKMPVGRHDRQDTSFTHQITELKEGDMVYILTDGYADQFGGEKGKKYKYASLKNQLIEIANLPTSQQKKMLENQFEKWKGTLEQVDDVCIVGVRI